MRILNYPGSKWGLSSWIISKFPKHHSYLEPYFGSGAILFNKNPSNIETVNDLDSRVYKLFKMIRENPHELADSIRLTPYSREEYQRTYDFIFDNDIEEIRQFLIQCWQGHGFRTNGHRSGWKNDVQGRERAYNCKQWSGLPESIISVADRLKQVQIENMNAIDLIKRFNFPNVLIYADPPYLLSTRSKKSYRHEMTEQDHCELLEVLLQHKGTVILSGYESDLYNNYLKGWNKDYYDTYAVNHSKRKEVLWMNYEQEKQVALSIGGLTNANDNI